MPTPASFAASTPTHPAVIIAETGQRQSYAELDDCATRLAAVFAASGLGPGDHVAFCLGNGIHTLAIAWGAHYAGAYYTPIATSLTADEIEYILRDCGATVVLADDTTRAVMTDVRTRPLDVRRWLYVGEPPDGFESYESALAAADPALPTDRREGREMLYSSGTTGRSKGVKAPLPAGAFGEDEPAAKGMAALFQFDTDTVYLSPAPLYHAAPLRFCMGTHRFGGTAVVMQKFDAEATLGAIEDHRVTHAQFVPTMFVRLLALADDVKHRYDVSSLRVVLHAAAPCPIEVKQRMIDWWGLIVHEYYGGTESNGTTFAYAQDWVTHPGTVGRPLAGAVHILDESGVELPPRSIGGVYFSGGQRFEYHGDAAKTASSYIGDLSTMGDVGYVDEDGFLYLTDRKANMIISGGVNIYPQEAENILAVHPAVEDVAVIGVPNDEFGEEVKAVVQPKVMPATAHDAERLEQELITYCRERIGKIKCPRSVEFRPTLPRTETGKLLKRLIRDEYWTGRTSGLV